MALQVRVEMLDSALSSSLASEGMPNQLLESLQPWLSYTLWNEMVLNKNISTKLILLSEILESNMSSI